MSETDDGKLKDLTEDLLACEISNSTKARDVIFEKGINEKLLSKWPKLKMKVPTIFLHQTVDIAQHVKKILKAGINFYKPYLGTNYTRIFCQTFNDHKAMLKYFDKNQLPYHTFGHPSKRKLKAVVRGLRVDMDLNSIKSALKTASVPVIRIHKMHMKPFVKDKDLLVLVVVPYSEEGKKILRVKKILGCDVQLEPPIQKTSQCYRCQKWGHSQRYCHGQVKCVKCAGDHISKKCTRNSETEQPTCANCGGNHTASFRECFYCPESAEYKKNQGKKKIAEEKTGMKPRELVTISNCNELYRTVKLIPRHKEAIPF